MKSLTFDPAIARTLRIEPPMTNAELEAFCSENDVARIERTREGVILMNPPAGFPSSSGNAEVVTQLRNWWKTHRRGAVGDSSAGYYLPDGSMMSPDASYLTAERFATVNPKLRGYPHVCPDFVIELLSESDSLPKTKQKMELWLANGAALAWLINPRKHQVFTYEPGNVPAIMTGSAVHGRGPVAGFVLDLNEVWACY